MYTDFYIFLTDSDLVKLCVMLAYELQLHAYCTVCSVLANSEVVIFGVNILSSLCINVYMYRSDLCNPIPLGLNRSQTQTTCGHYIVVPKYLSKRQ
jgi:hypothetical protein